MGKLSLSVGLASQTASRVVLQSTTPLWEQVKVSRGDSTAMGNERDWMVWSGRIIPISDSASESGTLLDLNIHTGDMVAVIPTSVKVPKSGNGEAPSTLICEIEDTGQFVQISDDHALSDMWPYLFALLCGEKNPDADPSRYALWVGRSVSNPNRPVEQLSIEDGSLLGLTRLIAEMSKVVLVLQLPDDKRQMLRIDRSPLVVGVKKPNSRAQEDPDIDLAGLLRLANVKWVSPRQVVFREADGQWSVQLDPTARGRVYVDRRIVRSRPMVLNEGDVLSFGPRPNKPELQLVVTFDTQ